MSGLETLDVGQANELKLAFRRAGWSNQDVKKFCEGEIPFQVLGVILGRAEIKPVEYSIDCDTSPFVPQGWSVEEHQKGGQFKWDQKAVELWLSEEQKINSIRGSDLREKLRGKPVLNACVLDFLLAQPHLIPEEWKGKLVFFWGTIYRDPVGFLYVLYLRWDGLRWHWSWVRLDDGWGSDGPAVLRASIPAAA